MPDWVCSVRNDVMNFTISPVVVQQVGLEDDVPNGFIWCEQGVDAVFRLRESIPGQHLGILSHGNHVVVEKVLGCWLVSRSRYHIPLAVRPPYKRWKLLRRLRNMLMLSK